MKPFQIPFFEEFATNMVGDPLHTNQEQQRQYLDGDVINDINKVAELGGTVEIDSDNRTLYIQRPNGTEYTLSGTDFDKLMEDVPHGVNPKNYFLWLSQQW